MKEKTLEKIKNIDITFDYEETYTNLYNTIIDYMNETQDFSLEYLFEDYIDIDTAEEIAKNEINQGGLQRLQYFIGDVNLNNNIFRIDGYGNLQDIDKEDLEYIKEQIIEELER